MIDILNLHSTSKNCFYFASTKMPDGIESFCKSQSIHFAKYHCLKVPLTQGYQAQNEMIFNIVVAANF